MPKMSRRDCVKLAAAIAATATMPLVANAAAPSEFVEVKIPYHEFTRKRPARQPSMLDHKFLELHTALEGPCHVGSWAKARELARECWRYLENTRHEREFFVESETERLLDALVAGGIDLERPFTMTYVVDGWERYWKARQVRDLAKEADDAAFHARMLEAAKLFQKRLRAEMKTRYVPNHRTC